MLIKLGCGGVDLSTLHDAIWKAIKAASMYIGEDAVITSTWEGTHAANSFHYRKRALDFRLPSNPVEVINQFKAYLGKDYDVLLEGDHVHVEYDPK